MTLPYDVARCAGQRVATASLVLDGIIDVPPPLCRECVDCQRRTAPGHPEWQTQMTPPLTHRRCPERITIPASDSTPAETPSPDADIAPDALFLTITTVTGFLPSPHYEVESFAGDLARMYLRYAERRGWDAVDVYRQPGVLLGDERITLRISGADAAATLRGEHGRHLAPNYPAFPYMSTFDAGDDLPTVRVSAWVETCLVPSAKAIARLARQHTRLKVTAFRRSNVALNLGRDPGNCADIYDLPTGRGARCNMLGTSRKRHDMALELLTARVNAGHVDALGIRRVYDYQNANTRELLDGEVIRLDEGATL